MKNSIKEIFMSVLELALLVALVFGLYKGVSFLRGIPLHRVYGQKAAMLTELLQDSDLRSSGATVADNGNVPRRSSRPESLKPYMVVLIPEKRSADAYTFYEVIAWSGKDKTSLNDLQTVIFCQYDTKSALYGQSSSAKSGSTGTSEFVRISYVNARTGECYDWEEIGKMLPNETSSAPHYKVSTNKLLAHVKKQLTHVGS